MTAAITLNFRKPELTIECVESLLADGWKPILVWDNSDDDGASLRVIKGKYAGDARIHLVHSPRNLGFGKGVNGALAELGRLGHAGPVLLINNDTLIAKGMRTALLAELVGAEVPSLVAPRILQDGQEQGWLYYNPWFAMVTKRHLPGSFAYLSGCCLLVMRNDNCLPLFDEDFFMYGEDVELSWRMRRDGGRLVLHGDCFVRHAGSASSGRASAAYERFLLRSHWLLSEKLAANTFAKNGIRLLHIPALLARACLRSWRYKSLQPLWILLQIFLKAGSSIK